MARFRVVTKHQISGWRFLFRRIEHALVRRDASMLDDPQRGRSTALSLGVVLACLLVAGSAVLAFFKPAKQIGDSHIIAEQGSGALYVHLGGRLFPALNLTSARLIVGAPENPVQVSSDELAKYPRGPVVGIPGAPGNIAQPHAKDSSWAVCDTTRMGASAPVDQSTGLPTTRISPIRVTVIGSALTETDASQPLADGDARLLREGSTTWLVYADHDHGIVRAAINLGDSAVTLALGIDATAPVMPASAGLVRAIPEAPPLRVPEVPGAGQMATLSSGQSVAIGSVLTVAGVDRTASYYLVSQSGVVQINSMLAAMFRNADSHGSVSSTTVDPDVIAANLRPGGWPGTASYPTGPLHILDPEQNGTTCYRWTRGSADPNSATGLLVGRQLPLAADDQSLAVPLVTGSGPGGATADAAYLGRDTGRFVRVTGADPASPLRESLFWISNSGVRYGIDAKLDANSTDPTITALNVRDPVLAPWSIVSLFAVGPDLSQKDARIQHDGIATDKAALGLIVGQP